MNRTGLDILIVGGGIAGCCAAIALTDRGHRVRIVEKQDTWRFQSSGIFVYANGLVSLSQLGLLDDILAAGYPVPRGRNSYYDHTGADIVETFYPTADQGRIPAILGIKRAEMHRVMSARVDTLGVPIQFGTTVQELEEGHGGIAAALSDGTRARYDLIIGADGVRSAIRGMIGIALEPRHTGFGVWRSVHRRPPGLNEKIMMMGPAKRFGIMPISDDLLYTFGTVAAPEGRRYDPSTWDQDMRSAFVAFKGPAEPFLSELGPDSEILYTAVEEVRLPLPWHRGRVLLIGHAAHASTPFMGQGGAMAMQDAVVLGRALEKADSPGQALETFGQARYPVCQFVQEVSRAVGEAGAEEADGQLDARNAEMRRTAQSRVDRFYTHLDGLNAEADARVTRPG